MSSRRKRSLGSDPFDEEKGKHRSSSVEKLIKGRPPVSGSTREVEMTVRLTPANLKHLDHIRAQLEARSRPGMTYDDLIRIAITLLSADDIT